MERFAKMKMFAECYTSEFMQICDAIHGLCIHWNKTMSVLHPIQALIPDSMEFKCFWFVSNWIFINCGTHFENFSLFAIGSSFLGTPPNSYLKYVLYSAWWIHFAWMWRLRLTMSSCRSHFAYRYHQLSIWRSLFLPLPLFGVFSVMPLHSEFEWS